MLYHTLLTFYKRIGRRGKRQKSCESCTVCTFNINLSFLYSSHNGFRIKSEIKLSEYNCNQDLVFSKTENQIGFSITKEGDNLDETNNRHFF